MEKLGKETETSEWSGMLFPYEDPSGDNTGSKEESIVLPAFHMGQILLELCYYNKSEQDETKQRDYRLDETMFRVCMKRASQNHERSLNGNLGSTLGYCTGQYQAIDAHYLFGANLAVSLAHIRPLHFIKSPPEDLVWIWSYLNDIFALEFSWVVSNWLIRYRDEPDYGNRLAMDRSLDVAKDIQFLRSWDRLAQSMFQYIATQKPDVSVLALYYEHMSAIR